MAAQPQREASEVSVLTHWWYVYAGDHCGSYCGLWQCLSKDLTQEDKRVDAVTCLDCASTWPHDAWRNNKIVMGRLRR